MRFYITTTLPYVNAEPHIGFALEIVQADVLARWHHQKGDEVFFNTGTDEHGLKIYRNALEQNIDPQKFCNTNATKFNNLKKALNLSYNNFIRTTDEHHLKAAQEFWQQCLKNGDIYKKDYRIKYCVGCELEKTESELKNDRCPIHPNLDLEIIEEENYFFKFSKYQNKLLELYKNNPDFVVPDFRFNEIKKFVQKGLEDFSISRLKQKMPWGMPVPDDEKHVIYVWFDALVSYISAIGWPDRLGEFNKWWPVIQVAGKDNLRQQSAMWQAMLMSAKLPTSKQILIHGFINDDKGQKISKSLGNFINPFDLVSQYGTDAVRYYLLAAITPFEDSDFSYQKFEEKYNADLANGLGNLVARVISLTKKMNDVGIKLEKNFELIGNWGSDKTFDFAIDQINSAYDEFLSNFEFNKALKLIFGGGVEIDEITGEIIKVKDPNNFGEITERRIAPNGIVRFLDQYITATKPWILIKQKDQMTGKIMYNILEQLRILSLMLYPFLPETSKKILEILGLNVKDELKRNNRKWGGLETRVIIKKSELLFPRI